MNVVEKITAGYTIIRRGAVNNTQLAKEIVDYLSDGTHWHSTHDGINYTIVTLAYAEYAATFVKIFITDDYITCSVDNKNPIEIHSLEQLKTTIINQYIKVMTENVVDVGVCFTNNAKLSVKWCKWLNKIYGKFGAFDIDSNPLENQKVIDFIYNKRRIRWHMYNVDSDFLLTISRIDHGNIYCNIAHSDGEWDPYYSNRIYSIRGLLLELSMLKKLNS